MQKENLIGVFDSGIGGVTVLKEIIKIMPKENYIYYSDSKNNPYGDKTKNEIINICDDVVNFLISKNCKIIVIACNTASAVAIQTLREKYPNIKFIGIEPAYKMVYDYAQDDETLIMATKGTIESEKFNLLYRKYNNQKTYLLTCSGLADIIEEGNKERINKYLNDNLGKYNKKVKNVVLGCTHYSLIKNEISKVLNDITFFEGANRLAIHLKNVLENEKLLNTQGLGKIEFIDTSKDIKKEKRFFKFLALPY